MQDRNELLYKISVDYYENKLTQIEIANKYNLTRQTISNMLKEAKSKGIVTIQVRNITSQEMRLEQSLEEKYNIQNVIIVPPSYGENSKVLVGEACSNFIEKRLHNYKTIGLGWGTTLAEYVKAANYINTKHKLKIIPLIGGLSVSSTRYHSNHLSFELAQKYQAEASYFYAPAIAENNEVYQAFTNSALVKDTLQAAKDVELAVMSVGNPFDPTYYDHISYITEEERIKLQQSGAIGDILSTYFDENGDEIQTVFSNRSIGLKLDDIEMLKEVAIIASGKEKARIIKALLNKHFIDHLIIDEDIAKELV